ncbi:hypothetical protein [Hymenobacter psoromatis]|uniref:hypothetical protein n=1 Tax=Hymenobacter psoromatis TaxID=1484116 RepID=UPI001CBDF2A4|nr:hypothetical protein [Hymenobacter psoromatis]
MKIHRSLLLGLLLCMVITTCYRADKYNNPDPSLLTLDNITVSGAADGSTPTEIKAHISSDATRAKRTVVFKTTLGSFKEGKGDSVLREASDNFTATAELTSTTVGTAIVSAKAYGITAKDKALVSFQRAYPNSITVTVDSFAISNRINSELIITATVKLDNGRKPSVGTPIIFNVYYPSNPAGPLTLAGAFVNNIRQASSDANGIARIRYSPGGVNYQGDLTITATTANPGAPDPTASTTVFLYKR